MWLLSRSFQWIWKFCKQKKYSWLTILSFQCCLLIYGCTYISRSAWNTQTYTLLLFTFLWPPWVRRSFIGINISLLSRLSCQSPISKSVNTFLCSLNMSSLDMYLLFFFFGVLQASEAAYMMVTFVYSYHACMGIRETNK